jgi:hypothetical protein
MAGDKAPGRHAFPDTANPAKAEIAAPWGPGIEPEMWRESEESGCELGRCTKHSWAMQQTWIAEGEQAALNEIDFCCLMPSAARSRGENSEVR